MFCSKCGKEIGDNVKFCSGCGTPVGQNQTKGAVGGQNQTAGAAAQNQGTGMAHGQGMQYGQRPAAGNGGSQAFFVLTVIAALFPLIAGFMPILSISIWGMGTSVSIVDVVKEFAEILQYGEDILNYMSGMHDEEIVVAMVMLILPVALWIAASIFVILFFVRLAAGRRKGELTVMASVAMGFMLAYGLLMLVYVLLINLGADYNLASAGFGCWLAIILPIVSWAVIFRKYKKSA